MEEKKASTAEEMPTINIPESVRTELLHKAFLSSLEPQRGFFRSIFHSIWNTFNFGEKTNRRETWYWFIFFFAFLFLVTLAMSFVLPSLLYIARNFGPEARECTTQCVAFGLRFLRVLAVGLILLDITSYAVISRRLRDMGFSFFWVVLIFLVDFIVKRISFAFLFSAGCLLGPEKILPFGLMGVVIMMIPQLICSYLGTVIFLIFQALRD